MKASNPYRYPVLILIMLGILQQLLAQTGSTDAMKQLGKGIIYLKEQRIIKNIRLKEMKSNYVVYEKDGSLHDRLFDEIKRIDFPDARPLPMQLTFTDGKSEWTQ